MREMPTGAKLFAGISLAGVGFLGAKAFEPVLTEGQRGFWFAPLNAIIGFAVGWLVLGRMVGKGYQAALGAGFTSILWLFFWSLSGFSMREMILRSMDRRYRSPGEAIGSVFEISLYYLKLAISPEVIGTLVIGGLLSGIVAEFALKRWK